MGICSNTDPMADNGILIDGVPLENVLIFIFTFVAFLSARTSGTSRPGRSIAVSRLMPFSSPPVP